MDSFEAATQFAQILRNLTPSIQNLTRAAHFALKHCESEDYLFPTILEIVYSDDVDLNTKATIFQFVEILFNESFYYSKNSKVNYPYVQNLKVALPKIILAILPKFNNSSIFNVFTSLKNISAHFKLNCDEHIAKFHSNLLDEDDMSNIKLDIPFPEEVSVEEAPDVMVDKDPLLVAWDLLIQKKKQSQYERARLVENSAVATTEVEEDNLFSLRDKTDSKKDLLSKRQIISRMEDDRESHKRSKEILWVVNRPKDILYLSEEEFLTNYWEKCNKLGEAEENEFLDTLDELNKLVELSYKDKQC